MTPSLRGRARALVSDGVAQVDGRPRHKVDSTGAWTAPQHVQRDQAAPLRRTSEGFEKVPTHGTGV
jgi:hypothetical protein